MSAPTTPSDPPPGSAPPSSTEGEGGGKRDRRAPKPGRAALFAALGAAGLSVAGNVLGRAVRDTLYLATFPVEKLPYFFLATGIVSAFAVSLYTRVAARFGPGRVVPALGVLAALVMPALWLGARGGSPWVVAVTYFWTTITGTFLVSGFWGVLGECFDPRTARQLMGIVGIATTVGGLAGGFGAHALLHVMDAEALLLTLGAVDFVMAIAVVELVRHSEGHARRAGAATPSQRAAAPGGLRAGVHEIARSEYLRDVAMLVVAVTVAGTLADYALKDAASRALSGKQAIGEFFSLFHGAVGAVTLGVQVIACRPLLERKGLAAALVALPIWLGASALGLVVHPGLGAATALRGGENATRNSFYRAAYELLFVPLPPAIKRTVKPMLDALVERFADALGAIVVLVLVTALGVRADRLGWLIATLAVAALWVVARVRRGYVAALSSNLVARAVELDELTHAAGDDATAREALRSTILDGGKLRKTLAKSHVGLSLMRSLELSLSPQELAALKKPAAAPAPGKASSVVDVSVALVRDLSDPSAAVAGAAVARWDGRDRRAVPFLVRLLAREELYRDVLAALARAGDRVAGALVDHLEDPDEAFAVRRRLPRALAAMNGPLVQGALVRALSDKRFEIRYHAAAALGRIAARASASGGGRATLELPRETLWTAIREEVQKSRSMWEAQRLLDDPDEATEHALAGAVQRRGAHSLRHVFQLLVLVLDPKPVELSYRAVQSNDVAFRAVGLEYLENVLPADVRAALWPLVGDDEEAPPPSRGGRSLQEVLAELAASGVAVPAPRPSQMRKSED